MTKNSGVINNQKEEALEALRVEHRKKCPHCSPQIGNLKDVFGEGNFDAKIMFVGEGPGAEEDKLGRPFVGRAGKLLDKLIASMNLERSDVYIANIVKVRPPENRVPTYEEAMLCVPFLKKQISIIEPEAIIALGATSTKYLLDDKKVAITKMRGNWQSYQGVPLMPTFHPAYLLRAYTSTNKGLVWSDLKTVLKKVGLPVPKRNSLDN